MYIESDITRIPWLSVELTSGNCSIDRAVSLNGNELGSSIYASRLSYCPKDKMTETMLRNCQRCNQPGEEMFYASLLPDTFDTDAIKYARITAFCETSDLFRNKKAGTQIMTFGNWQLQHLLTAFS